MYLKNIQRQVAQRMRQRQQERAISRRQFLKAGAITTAGLLTANCNALPQVANPPVGGPQPIPGGTDLGDPLGFIHMYLPTTVLAPPGAPTIDAGTGDPSVIANFTGTVGVFECFGGIGTDDEGNQQYWAADIRFQEGTYDDFQGNRPYGSFALI